MGKISPYRLMIHKLWMIKFRFHGIRPTGIKYSLWTMDYGHYAIHGGEFTRSAYFTQILTEISMIQHIYNLFQEYSEYYIQTLDSPDLSPGRTQLDTNRTNRTRSSGGKYESALFLRPALNYLVFRGLSIICLIWNISSSKSSSFSKL